METVKVQQSATGDSNKVALWTGWVISTLCILFFLVDAIMKVMKTSPSMEGSVQLEWPADSVQAIGIILLGCTILYIIPRTAILGAILLTGYLGGAISIMLRVGAPYFFPLICGVLVWCGLYLRNQKLRTLIPFHKVG